MNGAGVARGRLTIVRTVIEATATDEDGRLLEKLRTYQMKKPDEVGKKWQPAK